jgi:DNA repair protein RadA/Sms
MSKVKSSFFCQSCGSQSPKWLGKCPSCGEWNTLVEEIVTTAARDKGASGVRPIRSNTPILLNEVAYDEQQRITTTDSELNRVLGGGIVPGSLVLIGGEPGIGKSTLMLQIALTLPLQKVLYVSGEESEQQIKMRAERLGLSGDACYLLTETSTQNIFKQIEILEPELVVIDSIQTLASSFVESAAGSVSQVRECTAELVKYAKETGTPVFMIGHITKDGSLAGPKVLEHMVDTVLQFEGDRHLTYRILRTTKNRFGSTHELGIYEMLGSGLRQVSNPSEILINQRDAELSGISLAATMEGNRPLLLEIQALSSPASYGTPQRSSTGYDNKRMSMLLAVLEKRCGFKLGSQDIFLNVAGGLKVEDTAADLAMCAAIVSSFEDVPLPPKMIFCGEVGLAGEIRAVNRLESRVAEAEKLGYKQIVVSKYSEKAVQELSTTIQVLTIGKLTDLFNILLV